MKKLLLVLAIVLFAAPVWAGDTFIINQTNKFSAVCRHDALYCASMAQEKYPVKIWVGPTDNPNIWHAQTQAFIDGKWEWLHSSNRDYYKTKMDDFFKPQNEYSFLEFAAIMPTKEDNDSEKMTWLLNVFSSSGNTNGFVFGWKIKGEAYRSKWPDQKDPSWHCRGNAKAYDCWKYSDEYLWFKEKRWPSPYGLESVWIEEYEQLKCQWTYISVPESGVTPYLEQGWEPFNSLFAGEYDSIETTCEYHATRAIQAGYRVKEIIRDWAVEWNKFGNPSEVPAIRYSLIKPKFFVSLKKEVCE